MVLVFVVKDDVHLLGARTTYVRSEHNPVGRLAVHVFGFQGAVEYFNVSPAAVDVLLVFDRELYN